MVCNMGETDRKIRIAIGVVFSILALMNLNIFLALPLILIIYTVSLRWCFLYHFLDINTNPVYKHVSKGNIIEGLALSSAMLLLGALIYLIIEFFLK